MIEQTNSDDFCKCPFCAEQIKAKAVLCKYCHSKIPPHNSINITADNKQAPSLRQPQPLSRSPNDLYSLKTTNEGLLLGVLAVIICAGVAIVALSMRATNKIEQNTAIAIPLIKNIIQSECNDDTTSIDKIIAQVAALPKMKTGNRKEADRLNRIGLKALRAKKYNEAVKSFNLALNADPADPKYLSNLGFAEMNAGDLDSAEKHLYESLAMTPSRSVAWDDLGEVFAKKGEQDKAVACFLLGYRVSNGDTLKFLESLKDDEDPAIRHGGASALDKVCFPNSAAETPRENQGLRHDYSLDLEVKNIPPDFTSVTYSYGLYAAPGQNGFLGKPRNRWDSKPEGGYIEVEEPQTEEMCADSLSVFMDYGTACIAKHQDPVDELLKNEHLFLLPSGTQVLVVKAYGFPKTNSGDPEIIICEQVLIKSGVRKGQTCFVTSATKIDPLWRDSLTSEQQQIVIKGLQAWLIHMTLGHHPGDNCGDISGLSPKDQEIVGPVCATLMNCETVPIESGQETLEAH